MGGGDSREVTALAAFNSPSAFKKLEYLVKINLYDDVLVSFAKSFAKRIGFLYSMLY